MTSALERGGRIHIALIVVNGVAAAAALLTSSGQLGDTEARILVSTITITFAAAGGLICLTHGQRIGANALIGLPGSGLLAIGVALAVVL